MNRKKVELEQLGASHRGDGAEMARDVDFRPWSDWCRMMYSETSKENWPRKKIGAGAGCFWCYPLVLWKYWILFSGLQDIFWEFNIARLNVAFYGEFSPNEEWWFSIVRLVKTRGIQGPRRDSPGGAVCPWTNAQWHGRSYNEIWDAVCMSTHVCWILLLSFLLKKYSLGDECFRNPSFRWSVSTFDWVPHDFHGLRPLCCINL